jgi:hypothetical protein
VRNDVAPTQAVSGSKPRQSLTAPRSLASLASACSSSQPGRRGAAPISWDWWCDLREDYDSAAFRAGRAACRVMRGNPARASNPYPLGADFAQWNLGWNDQVDRVPHRRMR